jgi:hypothetical protein
MLTIICTNYSIIAMEGNTLEGSIPTMTPVVINVKPME